MHSGFFGVSVPRWSSLVAILFSSRGMLTQSPLLWFVPLGAWGMWRAARWRRECLLCLALGLAFIVYNAGYTNVGALRYGLRGLWSLAPLGVFLLCAMGVLTVAVAGRGPRGADRVAWAGVVGLLAIGYLMLAFPLDPLHLDAIPGIFRK